MTQQEIDEFCDLYDRIKREIQQKEPQFYQRWKAGGYLVDNNVVSMYPILSEIFESLVEVDEDEDEDEDDTDEV